MNDSDEIDQHSGCEMTGLFDAPVWAAVRDGKAGAAFGGRLSSKRRLSGVTLTKHATSIGSAGSGRYGMVERRPAHIYFRHFLFSINPPSAAAPEEVDCDARLA